MKTLLRSDEGADEARGRSLRSASPAGGGDGEREGGGEATGT